MSDRTVKDKNKNDVHQKDVPSKSRENIVSDTFLKRYKIIEKIGEGSYSEVLKCQNREDGTIVACKRLKHIYRSWGQVNEIAEIATLRTIQKHNNILQMMEIHYDECLGKVSLVFELMDVNLYEMIKDRKRLLPECRVRTIMFQLFRALRHLHKLGIFHRDIKPENILIKLKTDQLKLGDLGSVRGMFSRPPFTEYISTRWYRSPECLLTAGHYSHKMDVWAAGCVFYEVLTLRPLFPGSSEVDQISRINSVLGPPPMKLLETFQKQAELERETYRNQTQLNRRQHIQKVLDGYSSKYVMMNDSKSSSNKSIKNSKNVEFYFTGKEGTGLDKILPAHITREAKEIIKSCLQYDPEQRPTAQRVVNLSYFYELREIFSRNPEKVSSKPVLTICGETVTKHSDSIDLGTLGDRKAKRYNRGQPQRAYHSSKESAKLIQTLSSSKGELNNNKLPSSPNNSLGSLGRTSETSRILESKSNITKQGSKERKSDATPSSQMKICNGRSQAESENNNTSKIPTTKVRSKNDRIRKLSKSSSYDSVASEVKKPKPKQSETNVEMKSSTKLNSVSMSSADKLVVKNSSKLKRSSLESLESKESESCTTVSKRESRRRLSNIVNNNVKSTPNETMTRKLNKGTGPIQVGKMEDIGKDIKKSVMPTDISPYMKAPSELKFLQRKINAGGARSKPTTLGPHAVSGSQHQQQPQPSQTLKPQQATKSESVKVNVVPPKVAVAALKYANQHTNNSAAVARQLREVLGDVPTASSGRGGAAYSPEDSSYAPSVKIGKLRFRQKQQQQILDSLSSPENKQRSKIPLLVGEGESSKKSYKSTKLTSPPQNSGEKGSTDKWRNTGIPRRISMSPDREQSIRLLRESLTMDKNKRLKIRQDAIKNSHTNKYDYTTPQGVAPPEQRSQQRLSAAYSSGRYLNSTTDYENLDVQDTASSTAAVPPDSSRLFHSKATRITLPELTEEIRKPSLKSSELYPEMLDIYSSRYRGPDVNMNILKDGGNYVKYQDKAQEVKEKLNLRIQTRRQQQNLSSVGDHASKLTSQRNSSTYDYGHYSSMGRASLPREDEASRHKNFNSSRSERRPPVPPTKVSGFKNTTDANKASHAYREPSRESLTLKGGPPYHTRRPSIMSKDFTTDKSLRRRGTTEVRADFKEATKRRTERMRSTMRDEVFCSSDDDVAIKMRKKFDDLISERARRLSESLKSNPVSVTKDMKKNCDSRSEDDVSTKRSRTDKPRKYARRELRARMAESLTTNNYANWRSKGSQQLRLGVGLLDNTSNSGDYVQPSEKQYPSAATDLRSSRNDFQKEDSNVKHHRPLSRQYPFAHQQDRRGQIYTPPGNKPVYHSAKLGAVLQERKLRYSHNSPVPISDHSNYSHHRNIKEDTKKRQRI